MEQEKNIRLNLYLEMLNGLDEYIENTHSLMQCTFSREESEEFSEVWNRFAELAAPLKKEVQAMVAKSFREEMGADDEVVANLMDKHLEYSNFFSLEGKRTEE